jgi:hypothetical protein
MSWSYRSDRSDEVYGNVPGPVLVNGDTAAAPPSAPADTNSVHVYSADGAIAVRSHTAVITKGSAAAMTLAAPTRDGVRIEIQAGSAFAHVVTATGLIQDGVTGGAKNTYTTAAFVGSGCTLVSYNGKWHLISKNLGTTA